MRKISPSYSILSFRNSLKRGERGKFEVQSLKKFPSSGSFFHSRPPVLSEVEGPVLSEVEGQAAIYP